MVVTISDFEWFCKLHPLTKVRFRPTEAFAWAGNIKEACIQIDPDGDDGEPVKNATFGDFLPFLADLQNLPVLEAKTGIVVSFDGDDVLHLETWAQEATTVEKDGFDWMTRLLESSDLRYELLGSEHETIG